MKRITDEFSFMVAPSHVQGVGVFATHDIAKNTELYVFTDEQSRFIAYDSELIKSPLVKSYCEWYCVDNGDGYFCPADFGKMEIGWYLNHSENPNAYQKDYIYYSTRDIKKGEEITIDYGTLGNNKQKIKSEFHK